MNQAQAIAKCTKIIGKTFGYRVDPKALNAEERDVAKEKSRALMAQRQAAEKAMQDRRAEILKGDATYQTLKAEYEALKKAHEIASSGLYHKRITVGSVSSMFFSVRADGDTWAEVVEVLTAKAAK